MFSKMAVSISIICVASFGVLHHGGVTQEEGEHITQLQSNEPEPLATLPLKFVQDEDEHDSHLHAWHQHFHHMLKKFHNHWHHKSHRERHGDHAQQYQLRSIERDHQDELSDAHGEFEWKFDGEYHRGPVIFKLQDGSEIHQHEYYRLHGESPETELNTFSMVELQEVEANVPVLSTIPYIGHLFKNVIRHSHQLNSDDDFDERLPYRWLPQQQVDDQFSFESDDN